MRPSGRATRTTFMSSAPTGSTMSGSSGLKRVRHAHQPAVDALLATARHDPAEDADRWHTVVHDVGGGQRVRRATRQPDRGEAIDAELVEGHLEVER